MYDTTKVEDPDLKQRLGFLFRMPFHNVSLVINNTKEMDSGQYMCTVNVPDDSTVNGRNIGLVNLTVLGKSTLVFFYFAEVRWEM